MPFFIVVVVVVVCDCDCDCALDVGFAVVVFVCEAVFASVAAAFNDFSDIELELEPFRFFVLNGSLEEGVVSAPFVTLLFNRGDADRGGVITVLLIFSSRSAIAAALLLLLLLLLLLSLHALEAAHFGDGGSASGSINSRLESNNCFSARLINAETAF